MSLSYYFRNSENETSVVPKRVRKARVYFFQMQMN